MMKLKSNHHDYKLPPFGGIGSEFYFPLNIIFKKNKGQFNNYVFGQTKLFLSSGRDALNYIIEALNFSNDGEILLPSYLCKEVLKPFKNKINVVFYKINEDLSIDIDDIRSKVSEHTKAILVIHYFGYCQNVCDLKHMQKNHDFVIIEDVVQSFLSKCNGSVIGHCGDISISSYRKWVPVPDGCLLTFNENHKVCTCNLTSVSSRWEYILLRSLGLLTKYVYVKSRISYLKIIFRYCFGKSEELLSTYDKPAKMSRTSNILLDKFDYIAIINQRRKNFVYLLDNLQSETNIKPLFETLPIGMCPIGFPIIVSNRDELKEKLIENDVYPPIHWELPKEIRKNDFPISWNISEHILTIPLDQRYTIKDMKYIVSIIRQ